MINEPLPPKRKYVKKKELRGSDFIQFGNKTLNQKRLHNGELLIRYGTSRGSVIDFRKAIPISLELQSLLIDLIHTGKLNIQLQKWLEEEEEILLENLLEKCNLITQLGFKSISKKPEDYIARFKLLQGAIAAGNSSPKIIQELLEIIDKLVLFRKITKIQSDELKEYLS